MSAARLLGPITLALVLAGCTAGDPGLAASVGPQRLSVAEARELFAVFESSPDYGELVQADPEVAPIQGAAVVVGRWVQTRLLERAAGEFGVTVTDEDVTAALDAQIAEQLDSREAFEQLLVEQGLTEAEIREGIRDGLLRQELAAAVGADVEVTDDEVQAAYEANYPPTVRAIVTATQEEAQAAQDRVSGGEDFNAVAADVSIDGSASAGGEVGPLAPGSLPPELEDPLLAAADGDLVGPIALQDVFVVAERVAPQALEEVRGEIEAGLRDQAAGSLLDEFQADLNASDDIVVNPRFGRWDPQAGTVVSADPLGDLQPAPGVAQPAAEPPGGALPGAAPEPTAAPAAE